MLMLPTFLEVTFVFFSFQSGMLSGLHIIIFDEIDAICKARGSVVSILVFSSEWIWLEGYLNVIRLRLR